MVEGLHGGWQKAACGRHGAGCKHGQDAQLPDTAEHNFNERFLKLSRYALDIGAEGILFTCSAFGSAIDNVAHILEPVPVLKPNEAMFEAALNVGKNIAMVVTFEPAVAEMEAEFQDMAKGAAVLTTVIAKGATDALRAGDANTHDRKVCEAARELSGYDAIMLAHFSTARTQNSVSIQVGTPVLSSPTSAVASLRRRCVT